jgi:predicted lipoprotein with Yx(FWY)xxD motif
MSNRWWAAAGVAAAVVVLAACGSSASTTSSGSGTGSPATVSGGTGIKTVSTTSGKVLTNTKGLTLYWYAIDTPTKSMCSGTCAMFWPAVPASTKVASGVSLPGTWGSVTDANGTKQLTYDGHPLYTFKLDTAAGQIKGNGVTTSGGASADLWWAATPTMAKLAKPAPSASSSSSGSGSGGYGY